MTLYREVDEGLNMLDAPLANTPRPAQRRSTAQAAFVHGARGMLIGSVAGAAAGFLVGLTSTRMSMLGAITSFAILFGFVFAPALFGAVGAARAVSRELLVRAPARILFRSTAAAIVAGVVWGAVGSAAAYMLGSVGGLNFSFQSLLMLGTGFGVIVGGLGGLVMSAVGLRRRS